MEQSADASRLDERQMVIHFIKHLVSITLKRNSFYVALGVTRLLCRYPTAEAMELYNLIVQDPGRVKDDYYWRSRKGHLMQEMKERFGDLIRTARGQRGEERFQACENSSRHALLVKECLDMFLPWNTTCSLPQGVEAVRGEINALAFNGGDPDQEHQIELARMHTILHLNCLERLIAGLGLAPFFERLELPQFFLSQGGNADGVAANGKEQPGGSTSSQKPADLNSVNLKSIQNKIEEYEELRHRAYSERLRVLVDGFECANLEPEHNAQTCFEVEEGAELIEVRTSRSAGDVLLAAHLLSYDELQRNRRPLELVTRLARGHNISFTISPLHRQSDEPSGANISIGYYLTNPLLRPANYIAGISGRQQKMANVATLLRFASVIGLIAVTATVGLWLYYSRQPQTQKPLIAAHITPDPVATPNPASTQLNGPSTQVLRPPADERANSSAPTGKDDVRNSSWPRRPSAGNTSPDVTRDISHASSTASLLAVQKIYVDLEEGKHFEPSLRDHLNRQITDTQRWSIAPFDDADTALVVTTSNDGTGITARLVYEDGHVIWPGSKKHSRIYRGTPEQAASQLIADLLAELRRAEKNQPAKSR